MSINSLDGIIRKVSKNVNVSARTQKRLIVERKQQSISILKKEPRLASLFGSQLEYYIISSGDRTTNNVFQGQLNTAISSATTNQSLDVVIHYEVSCPLGQEEKVLRALCSSHLSPVRELTAVIEKGIANYNRLSGWQFFENYIEAVEQLQVKLAKDVEQSTGLHFHAVVSLPQSEQLAPFVIQPVEFSAAVQACNDRLTLQISAELTVDKANKAIAILKIGREFELANVVKAGVRRYLRERVSIQSFYADLSGPIKSEIATYLKPLLAEYGRQVKKLSLLAVATVPENSSIETVRCCVPCQLQKPKAIEFDICSTLHLQLVDVGLYRREQVLSLDEWAQEKLGSKMIRAELFGKSYADVVLGFDAIADAIQRKMTAAASEIGYVLHTIDVLPDLEPFRLTQPFDLVLQGQIFRLSGGHKTVPLDVTLCLYLSSLDAISNQLSPDILIESMIAKTVVEEINAVLSSATPDTFRRWIAASNTIDANASSDAFTVEDALMPCIQTVLASQFKAVVERMTVSAHEDEQS